MRALCLILSFALWAKPLRAEEATKPAPPREMQTKRFWAGEGRAVALDMVLPKDRSFATFLFLPGIAGKLAVMEPALIELAKRGYGVVSMNFSTQLFSPYAMGENTVPFFKTHDMTMKDFAFEAEQVAKTLGAQFPVGNVIPVSLSFSGGATPYLSGFPLIIETSPLTSSTAANPQGESYRAMLKGAEFFNPFFGPQATRQALDGSYHSFWAGTVDEAIKNAGLAAAPRETYIGGFSAMSRATEGFDWKNVEIPKNVERLFLIAGNESHALKTHQRETAQRLSRDGYQISVQEIENSGHIISRDKPAVYVEVLAAAAKALDCRTTLKPGPH